MAEALSLYLPPRQLKAEAAQAVESLQQRLQDCEGALAEAQRRFEEKRQEVADVVEDEGHGGSL